MEEMLPRRDLWRWGGVSESLEVEVATIVGVTWLRRPRSSLPRHTMVNRTRINIHSSKRMSQPPAQFTGKIRLWHTQKGENLCGYRSIKKWSGMPHPSLHGFTVNPFLHHTRDTALASTCPLTFPSHAAPSNSETIPCSTPSSN